MKLTEEEIRPEKVFTEYLKLTTKDVEDFFGDVNRDEINCPACGSAGDNWANKAGFNYKKCNVCLSLFVSPRPKKEAFDAYYTDSPSTKFWATTFYKVTEVARREKLWKPKARLVKDIINKFEIATSPVKFIIDIGGGYGVFDEEIRTIMPVTPIVIEPSIHLANICRSRGLHVVEKFMEDISLGDLPDGPKCYVSFELFEHLYDPELFLKTVYDNMNSGDLFVFTTLSGMGLDIQVLGEHAKALSPPHHLNFLNPHSVTMLLIKVGFKVLEAATPGKLDVDILNNNKAFIKDEFWKNVLQYSTQAQLADMQQFISAAGLSSHMMISCKKV